MVAKRKNDWRSWFKLRSKKQTLRDVVDFLEEKGLSDGKRATEKAIGLGYAKDVKGKERWNVRKYHALVGACKKVERFIAMGKPIDPSMLAKAMIDESN